ncbi:MAG TPA: hypothetical protein VKF63_00890, partial [Terracidiphilus sp.]|nr:hypothetical protein [Terracidiphilus sp.]
PGSQVRFLVTSGKLDRAVEFLRGSYRDGSIDQSSLDGLAAVLGYSGVHETGLLVDATSHAFRTGGQYEWTLLEAWDLVPLFQDVSADIWRPNIVPFLENPATRLKALILIGLIGDRTDIPLIKRYLAIPYGAEGMGETQGAVLDALLGFADCTAIDSVSNSLFEMGPNALYGALRYIESCGRPSELERLARLGRQQVSAGSVSLELVPNTVQSLYSLGGKSSIPAIEHILAGMPTGDYRSDALARIFDTQILPTLRSGLNVPQESARAQIASMLAERGDPSGLATAAEIAARPEQRTDSRVSALAAFRWFKGPAIQRFLYGLAKANSPGEAEVRAMACSGLRWYDDEATLSLLVARLGDQSSTVRDLALHSLTFTGSRRTEHFLEDNLKTLGPVPRVYAALALQRIGSQSYPEIFRDFLENKADQTKDYSATVRAIQGLRNAYLRGPTSVAVDALRDERREVRLAASLALSQQENAQEAKALLAAAAIDKDPHFRLAASRALWAMGVFQRADNDRAKAAAALSRANLRVAERILNRVYQSVGPWGYNPSDFTSVLKSTLSVPTPRPSQQGIMIGSPTNYTFEDVFDPAAEAFIELTCDIDAKSGHAFRAVDRLGDIVLENPSLRMSLREDPYLAQLRNIYRFRVMIGMQEPITVENINLPQPNPPSPKAPAANPK